MCNYGQRPGDVLGLERPVERLSSGGEKTVPLCVFQLLELFKFSVYSESIYRICVVLFKQLLKCARLQLVILDHF